MKGNKIRNRILLEAYFKNEDPRILELLPYSIPQWHLDMLKDKARLDFYNQIIKDNVKDKIVLDVGTGSGILSHLAIKHGARKVYSVEMQPAFQDIYSVLLEKSINDGLAMLIEKNAVNLTLDDLEGNRPEVVIHEIFGADIFSENIIGVIDALKLKNIFSQDTKFLPQKFKLMAEGIIFEEKIYNQSLEDYEDFSLSKLERLKPNTQLNWGYHYSKQITVEKTGSPQVLYESTLPDFTSLDNLVLRLNNKLISTHIRTWMILEADDYKLETHHDVNQSHWTNTIFKLSETMLQTMEIRFKVKENKLVLQS